MDAEDISTYGRVTKGVRLMRLEEGMQVVSVARTEEAEEDDAREQVYGEVADVRTEQLRENEILHRHGQQGVEEGPQTPSTL